MSSLGIAGRLKHHSKQKQQHDLMKSHSQAQILANKLKQDGLMSTVEHVMQAMDQVAALLVSPNVDMTISYKDSIINLCQHLKVYGAYLDILYQDQLNRAFVTFRNSSQDDERLDFLSRLHLLELIELRANDWKGSDLMNQYYRNKADISVDTSVVNEPLTLLTSTPILAPGEVLKPSGKFKQPTRIAGKNYCKDEVVIRNADSGKVNPGAKERLVQITGANEESIEHAKQLIEDTIRRNASPVREYASTGGPLTGSSSSINSSASEESGQQQSRARRSLLHSLSTNDANIGEYKYTVVTGGHTIKITGDNLELVRMSKLVLDEYFSGEPIQDIGQFYSFDSLSQSNASDMPPLSPPDSLPSPRLVTNGQQQADECLLRRPNLSIEEIMKGSTTMEAKATYRYSIETLARLAQSPLSLTAPNEWQRITKEFPDIAKKTVEPFDAS